VGDAARGAEGGDFIRLGRGCGPEAMVDGDGEEPRPRPVMAQIIVGQQQQRQRVGAAGNGNCQRVAGVEIMKKGNRVEIRRHRRGRIGRGGQGSAQQEAEACS
jgi:hypothetical protein